MSAAPIKYNVKITDNSSAWLNRQNKLLFSAIQQMASNIMAEAQMTVPKAQSKRLWGSAHVKVEGQKEVDVIFGSGSVKYAAYQERGKRADGTHVVKRYTTQGTGKHYLGNAGNNNVKKGLKWYLSHS